MNSNHESKTIINYFDQAPLATEFQRIFLKLENLNPAREAKTLLITSSVKEEGKSTIASFFAIAMSQFGNRPTILIDADLRKPTIDKLFNLNCCPGLAELLEKRANLLENIRSTVLTNLKIITGGMQTTDGADGIFEDQSLRDLLNQLRTTFTFIIIDSAPVMVLPDALNLSRLVDGVVLVVKAGATPKEVVKRASETIKDSGGNLLGVILNDVERALPDYYSYKYKYYKYKYAYEKKK
ncbi:MAG: CpsD/CapB family tyrosine-protein kinase [Candidatus Zixiibacteriota bacterium]